MLKVGWIESNEGSRFENNYSTNSEVFFTRASFKKYLEFNDLLCNRNDVKQLSIYVQSKVLIFQPGI